MEELGRREDQGMLQIDVVSKHGPVRNVQSLDAQGDRLSVLTESVENGGGAMGAPFERDVTNVIEVQVDEMKVRVSVEDGARPVNFNRLRAWGLAECFH